MTGARYLGPPPPVVARRSTLRNISTEGSGGSEDGDTFPQIKRQPVETLPLAHLDAPTYPACPPYLREGVKEVKWRG